MSTPRAYGGMSDSRRLTNAPGAWRDSKIPFIDVVFALGAFLLATASGVGFGVAIIYFLFV